MFQREIRNENGIPELIRLLRKTDQEDVKESVTGVLWNLSSAEVRDETSGLWLLFYVARNLSQHQPMQLSQKI